MGKNKNEKGKLERGYALSVPSGRRDIRISNGTRPIHTHNQWFRGFREKLCNLWNDAKMRSIFF
jgi:hypothetical protein